LDIADFPTRRWTDRLRHWTHRLTASDRKEPDPGKMSAGMRPQQA